MARILIIDDSATIRLVLQDVLEHAGYETFEASDGRVGVIRYRTERPDLVMIDMVMPEKDGLETITELRAEFPDAKIIAMSGGDPERSTTYLACARALGANRSIAKPFTPEAVLETIQHLLLQTSH